MNHFENFNLLWDCKFLIRLQSNPINYLTFSIVLKNISKKIYAYFFWCECNNKETNVILAIRTRKKTYGNLWVNIGNVQRWTSKSNKGYPCCSKSGRTFWKISERTLEKCKDWNGNLPAVMRVTATELSNGVYDGFGCDLLDWTNCSTSSVQLSQLRLQIQVTWIVISLLWSRQELLVETTVSNNE